MKNFLAHVSMLTVLVLVPGCPGLVNALRLDLVTVRLVNNSDFSVDGQLFTDDEQDLPREVLVQVGTERTFNLAAGEMQVFTMACDDLQSIVIDDADLRVLVGVSPDASTDVLRDGDDFGCGDTVTFTFSHSAVLVDFDIAVSVAQR